MQVELIISAALILSASIWGEFGKVGIRERKNGIQINIGRQMRIEVKNLTCLFTGRTFTISKRYLLTASKVVQTHRLLLLKLY
jgi:hypothetical protein